MPRFLLHALSLAALAGSAAAQTPAPLRCDASATSLATLRPGGQAEPMGEIVLVCRGGVPAENGGTVPQVTLTVEPDSQTRLTSRVVDAGLNASEALVVIDHPEADQLRACPRPAGCALLGTGNGRNTYQPAAPVNATREVFNVFQGTMGDNRLTFTFPLDPPGPPEEDEPVPVRRLRVVNLRMTAGLRIPVPTRPSAVKMTVTLSGPGAPVKTEPEPESITVAWVRAALETEVLWPGSFSRSEDRSVEQGAAFRVRIREGYPDAFRAQASESGFSSTSFPQTGGLNRAGVATQGTRLFVRFNDVPAGVRLHAPVRAALRDAEGLETGRAVMIATGSDGSGPLEPMQAASTVVVEGVTTGLAPVTSFPGGEWVAVYEIEQASAIRVEEMMLPVFLTYSGATGGMGTAMVSVGLAPVLDESARNRETVPRFTDVAARVPAFSLTSGVADISFTSTTGNAATTQWFEIRGGTACRPGRYQTPTTLALPAGGYCTIEWLASGGVESGTVFRPFTSTVVYQVPSVAAAVNGTYRMFHRLCLEADPPAGPGDIKAGFVVSEERDGIVVNAERVAPGCGLRVPGVYTVTAIAPPGFEAGSWTGSFSASGRSLIVDLSQPVTLKHQFREAGTELRVMIKGKEGPKSARKWTVWVQHVSGAVVTGQEIAAVTLTATGVGACTNVPAALTPLPAVLTPKFLHIIQEAELRFDFSACPDSAEYRAAIRITGNGGSYTRTETLEKQQY